MPLIILSHNFYILESMDLTGNTEMDFVGQQLERMCAAVASNNYTQHMAKSYVSIVFSLGRAISNSASLPMTSRVTVAITSQGSYDFSYGQTQNTGYNNQLPGA